jgi:hypothetical protein
MATLRHVSQRENSCVKVEADVDKTPQEAIEEWVSDAY